MSVNKDKNKNKKENFKNNTVYFHNFALQNKDSFYKSDTLFLLDYYCDDLKFNEITWKTNNKYFKNVYLMKKIL
ncbi:MAG: hypothetical protein HPAVJP_2960 [Candidatus Hepatoplasma vulgare]|nr:MAG: hypothetical protein HPAVJP_2960 [Candidatus Hepatoplasma sp.]